MVFGRRLVVQVGPRRGGAEEQMQAVPVQIGGGGAASRFFLDPELWVLPWLVGPEVDPLVPFARSRPTVRGLLDRP